MTKFGRGIRVGAVDYRVTQPDDISNNYEGEVDFRNSEIRLRRGTADGPKYGTVWHEVLHAILNNAGLHDVSADETVISALSAGVTQVLRDNVWVRRFYEEAK